jgi:hypothetical protein
MANHKTNGSCVSPAATQAYRALMFAAERIGRANYQAGLYRVRRDRRGRVTTGYSITETHQRVINTSSQVCGGRITPEEAMAVLHEYDVLKERLADKPKRRSR